ncbi:receptor-like protein 2 [Pyrus ussuriensis x Pyrus communis]|uniref:Receptor-like protein 2 n=1 Tax=Pyrus ussuriensis x Pyrus communis TaxID=2448454 RepID=A0A5N5G184_9ROSA|nr:receptor-like protein 2 [Pyrus ussuriensis x Pyrus communis]
MLLQPDHLRCHGFLFILLFSSLMSTIHACYLTERNCLMSFSHTLQSSAPLNWTSVNCCHWEGITCDHYGWITRLSLPAKDLEGGMFPSSLGNLTHLTHLDFSHNSLYGSLETEFFLSLNRLEILDLSYNHFYGELPFSLPSSNIRMLDLSCNRFHGEISSSFFKDAWNLTSFNISNNIFTGSIPSAICPHSSPFIRILDFSLNRFSGNIPLGLGKCSKLQIFRAGNNNLSGLLPSDIYNATTLQEISFPRNQLYGVISEGIGNLTNLQLLDLNTNGLSGTLPVNIGKLSKLQLVYLHFNNLDSSLPPSLTNCSKLIELNVGFNNFEGDISLLNFSKLSQLSKLDIVSNHFTGMVPVSLYSCKSLKALRLSLNDLEGQIQPEILLLKSLSFLSLGGNKLTNITGAIKILMGCKSLTVLLVRYSFLHEEMPAYDGMVSLYGFQNLRILGMSYCEITGEIPVWLSKLKKLEVLYLPFNRITGLIPSWLGTLPMLFYINIDSNRISGEFPKELCRLPTLLSETESQTDHNYLELPIFIIDATNSLHQNYFSKNLPRALFLQNNCLTGKIPIDIGQLQLLHALDLCSNNFSGNIPDTISNLKNLETVDLSMNHLSGEIPASLAVLNFLSLLNVSYNRLEGPIPTSTQLQSFNPSAFEGNLKLCGAPLPNECQPVDGITTDDENNQDLDDDEEQSLWFGLSVVLGFFVGLLGFCCPLLLKRTWRYAYFQLLDNVQFMLYVKWRRLRRKTQGHVPNQKDEVKSSKPDSETESANQSEYANSNSFMVPDNFQTTSLFNVPVKAPCPEDEEILMCTD